MQPIDVRSQTRLSLARTFNLCLKGIRHRMFRSMLTTLVIILAVAFFMVLLADSITARAVGLGVQTEVRLVRRSAVATDLWFGKPSPGILAERLASTDAPLAAYQVLTGWEGGRMRLLAEACTAERSFLRWLDSLDAGTRSMLVGTDRSDEALPILATEDGWATFRRCLAHQPALHPPLTEAGQRSVVRLAPATAAELVAFATAWHAGIDAIGAGMQHLGAGSDREEWIAWLAAADIGGLQAFASLLAEHGLGAMCPSTAIAELQADLRADRLRQDVTRRLRSDEGRDAWMRAFGRQQPLEEKLLLLTDPRADSALGSDVSHQDRTGLADAVRRERDLASKERNLAGKLDPAGGLVSTRQAFLILISLVVCMVGIANAMLMAITERFREIATMKCLGATDGFILTQFLMEAGIQGAAGGALGMGCGLLFSLLKGSWLYGAHLLWYFPLLGLLAACTICIFAGLLLATLASIYPSWVASRMAPMEAMRVE
jgi:hypothetical protein